MILGIETTCDETAAALVNNEGALVSNVVFSQEELHHVFRGVVPEVASRAHTARLLPIIEKCLNQADTSLNDLEAIAVTHGPGLLGSLIVGLTCAKSLAYGLGIPLIAVDHLEAHIAGAYMAMTPQFPVLVLVVSGGHTHLFSMASWGKLTLLGQTLDDAVGEAYDKVASLLDLPYPGGPAIDSRAQRFKGDCIELPIPLAHQDNFSFSFSGLKTAVKQWIEINRPLNDDSISQVCASFQHAATEALTNKLKRAVDKYADHQDVVICGGVSCNQGLRSTLKNASWLTTKNLILPEGRFCTDNAAMVARLGYFYSQQNKTSDLKVAPYTSLGASSILEG